MFKEKIQSILKNICGALVLPVLMYVVMMIFCFQNGKMYYGSVAMWRSLISTIAASATCAYGIGIQFKSGRLDFSAGSVMLLSAIIAGNVSQMFGNNLIIFSLLCIFLCVLLNIGVAIVYIYGRLPIIIVTLGMALLYESITAVAAASAELSNVHAELKAVESTLREKKDLQKQLLAYIKTKPARDGLRAQKTEKARRAYREQHESEFIISESAARYFKAQGISKLPASKALQTEIEQLTKEKNALYNEYREKKANVRELQTVKSNLDKILRREPERGKGRENER